jgi:hypothetical protein
MRAVVKRKLTNIEGDRNAQSAAALQECLANVIEGKVHRFSDIA